MKKRAARLAALVAFLCLTTPCLALEWSAIYGGTGWDQPRSIQPTTDGGYIVAGETSSFRDGHRDLWILKLDSDGSVLWQKLYGGATAREDATAWSVKEAFDGGYVVTGTIFDPVTENQDFLVLKLYPDGQPNPSDRGVIQWQRRYGGSFLDLARSVDRTSDGGYVVAGNLRYDAGRDHNDFWVLKLRSDGTVDWQRTYGTSDPEQGYAIQQTADGGYIVAGFTEPDPFDFRNADVWVLKLYPDGQPNSSDRGVIEWQRKYDNNQGDQVYSIRQTTDGGYVMVGITNSLYLNSPNDDVWVVKLFPNGTIEWEKRYGGDGPDVGFHVNETSDGGYVIAGATSTRCFSVGYSDYWIAKLHADGTIEWEKTFGGSFSDYAYEIHEVLDGGYVVIGDSASFGSPQNGHQFLALKMDRYGDIPGCNAVGSSMAAVINTSATVSISAAIPATPAITAVDATLAPQVTTAEKRDACFSPYIDEILPAFNTGRRFAGKTVTLIGGNFGDTQGSSVLNLNGKTFDATSSKIRIWTDKLIRIDTPKYDCGKYNSRGFIRRKVWITLGDSDSSNVFPLKLTKPESCP